MSKLYIIPSPIGNLKDITLRGIEVLNNVDLILAEDTRVTVKLLNQYKIKNKLSSYQNYNEHKKLPSIIEKLKLGIRIALISDAGTPGISDPGFLLIRECLKNNIEIECLPGPTAVIPALIESGFPCERFVFEGFLPPKKGKISRIKSWAETPLTIILFESPHRLIKTLDLMKLHLQKDREISISREISKKYHESIRGNIEELVNHFSINKPKGEFVIVIKSYK